MQCTEPQEEMRSRDSVSALPAPQSSHEVLCFPLNQPSCQGSSPFLLSVPIYSKAHPPCRDLSFVPKSLGNPHIYTSASHILSLREMPGSQHSPSLSLLLLPPLATAPAPLPGLLIETALAPAT